MKLVVSTLALLLVLAASALAVPLMGTTIGNVDSVITSGPHAGLCGSGAAGMMVRQGNGVYILTNAHVGAGVAEGGPYPPFSAWTMPAPGYLAMPTGQRNPYGGHNCNPTLEAQDTVAYLTTYTPFAVANNLLDAAIGQLRTSSSASPAVRGLRWPISGGTVMGAAGMTVSMVAPTQNGGTHTGKIINMFGTVTVPGNDSMGFPTGASYSFTNQIVTSFNSQTGDSGAVLWTNTAICPAAVGLHFASDGFHAFANPIGLVLAYFGVTPVGSCGPPFGVNGALAQASTPSAADLGFKGAEEGADPYVEPATPAATPEDLHLSPADSAAKDVVTQYADDFVNKVPGCYGMWSEHDAHGNPVIVFALTHMTPEAKARIPHTLNGMPVKVEVGGHPHFD